MKVNERKILMPSKDIALKTSIKEERHDEESEEDEIVLIARHMRKFFQKEGRSNPKRDSRRRSKLFALNARSPNT
jgi:hypothetical protein